MDSCLKGHGGKFYLAPWIVSKLTAPHKLYVEPYFFTGAVMLEKPYIGIAEVANDIDGNLTNFWRVLQDKSLRGDMIERLRLTPFSQQEYEDARNLLSIKREFGSEQMRIELACAYFIMCRQSMAGRLDSFAPISKTRTRGEMCEQVSAWMGAIDHLLPVSNRMIRVAIFNDKAVTVAKREDGKDTLFYFDPPYYPTTRESPDVYGNEMSVEDHKELLDFCLQSKSKIAISGYHNPTYDTMLADWVCDEHKTVLHSSSAVVKPVKTECLWRNYK